MQVIWQRLAPEPLQQARAEGLAHATGEEGARRERATPSLSEAGMETGRRTTRCSALQHILC